jgi:NADPH2:quinone reductase
VRAAICRSYGPPEVVHVEDVDVPTLQAGQVRVRVHAAAINYPDVLLVADRYQVKVRTPFIPGSEFAGVVTDVADDVVAVAVGDRVSGTLLVGAFADELVVAATSLTHIPENVDDATAAACGVAHLTAYLALRPIARLQDGEQLIVLGAGGGVGLATVQLGALLGATVTAVASSGEKLEVATANGAAHVVDRRNGDLRAALRAVVRNGADVVIDPVGGAVSEPALRSLRWGGRFVSVGYASGDIPRIPLNIVLLKGVNVTGFQMIDVATHRPEEFNDALRELRELLAAGRVRPHIGATFALDDTAAALRHVADGHAIGKVIIDLRA